MLAVVDFVRNFAVQDLIESILPNGYSYQVEKVKLIERGKVDVETKFKAEFSVNVCSTDDKDTFVNQLQESTETTFLAKRSPKERTNFVSQRLDCNRNVRLRLKPKGKKRHGSGRQLGEEKQPGKATGCEAFFSYKFKACESTEHKNNKKCQNLSIKLDFCHNHTVSSTESWNFQPIAQETKTRYFELFQAGYTASRARNIYVEELKSRLGLKKFFENSSKRSVNPSSTDVFHLSTKFYSRLGSANGPDSFMPAVEVGKIQIPHLLHTCTSSTLAPPPHLHLPHTCTSSTLAL